MNAGDYGDRCQWQKRILTKDSLGQDVETWTDNGGLWCAVSVDSGRVSKDYGVEQSGQSATIRVRNYVLSLAALDRLYAVEWGETWIVDSVRRGDNEVVCDCHRYDALDLGGVATAGRSFSPAFSSAFG